MKLLLGLTVLVTLALGVGSGTAGAASTTSIFGDADCSTAVGAPDMLAVLAYAGDVEASLCVWAGDVNCDNSIDVKDALAIGLNVAGVTQPTGGCTHIGVTVPRKGILTRGPYDFEVFGKNDVGTGGIGNVTGAGGVGDTYNDNLGRRSVVGFDLTGVEGPISNATLSITIAESRQDQFPAPGIIDGSPPFTNPGLGDVVVINIDGEALLNTSIDRYGTPSIGNDPGVLIPGGTTPDKVVALDVTAALQQAIDSGAEHLVLRLQPTVESDDDNLNDLFFVVLGSGQNLDHRPQITYTTGS